MLSALGAGIGGLTASHIIEKGENGSGLATGAGVWLGGSAAIALFLGAYFATRYSEATHRQVGAAQGILIAAIFFYLLLNATGVSLGSFSELTGHLANNNATSNADEVAKNIAAAGWMLFVSICFGIVAAVIGGIEGTTGNVRRPFSRTIAAR